MKRESIRFASGLVEITLPEQCHVLAMKSPPRLANVAAAVQDALANPMGTASLAEITRQKLRQNPAATAVIVVSDCTRPVPYKGEEQILWPVVAVLLEEGIPPERITILVTTGTHRAMSQAELETMLDARVFEAGVSVVNHNCRDPENLVYLGTTSRGTRVQINRLYYQADLKILTGLVESHFMAGASGGRKAICPGLVGEESTQIFHGAAFLASPHARDLVLEGNPCHEEALEVAKMAGADFIINVTVDHEFAITGVYDGDLEQAHEAAVERIKNTVSIPIEQEYDLVISHAGFVGINHYQAAKVGVASLPALKPGGRLVVVADNTDVDPVGSLNYKTVLRLLKLMGSEKFNRLLLSPDWTFIPDQWQVQMWARVFAKIPPENFVHYAPQFTKEHYGIIPGVDGSAFLKRPSKQGAGVESIGEVLASALARFKAPLEAEGRQDVTLAFLADGPYGIPVRV